MSNSQSMSRDCADVCALTARVLARRGPAWRALCDACARIGAENKDCDCCVSCVKSCRACRDARAAANKKLK